MIECHSPRFAIRGLNGTFQGGSQTVSEVGWVSGCQSSIVILAAFGNENFDLWIGNDACDGRGHHFERADTPYLMSETTERFRFSGLRAPRQTKLCRRSSAVCAPIAPIPRVPPKLLSAENRPAFKIQALTPSPVRHGHGHSTIRPRADAWVNGPVFAR